MTSVIQWESTGMQSKGDPMLKVASPPLHQSHGGEACDTGEMVHDLRDEVTSLEEALSQMGASFKMHFHFAQSSRLPSEQSSLPGH